MRSLDAFPNNLPLALSSFVGRERELGELREALSATRLLTLTGPGGCGKTRLGLRFASDAADRFPDGVWWVDLAQLAEERLVAATVAEALEVRPLPGFTELQAVCTYLASRRAMVVLDNCEHLLEACAGVVEPLLQACPEVTVLATSRAPLGVTGETDWRVPPLSLPEDESDALARSDAVALFVERACQVSPGFAVTEENVSLVVRLCRDLDGLPLAIELAAARLRMLSTEQIATGLSDRFRLLTGGPRTALERQQTLRASVDWSYELLSAEEQRLLRRLAVFISGFTLEAAESVCAGDGLELELVLDLLGSLVGQSLVIAEPRGPATRYRLLETVREYALERLADAGEEEALRGRHRDLYLAVAEEAAPHLETSAQLEWHKLLDPEAANLAAGLDYAIGSDPPLALRFCAALWRDWWAGGRFAEAELAFSRSLEAAPDREPTLRARVLFARALTATAAGRFDDTQAYATDALALADEVGDGGTAARARCQLGSAVMWLKPAAARTELARAAEVARTAGDDWALVDAKQWIAQSYLYESDHVRAAATFEEVAALAEQVGDPFQLARYWLWFSHMTQFDGRLSEARDAAERARIANDIDEPVMAALADVMTASIDIWEGAPGRALELLQESLERALRLGAGISVPVLLFTIARQELATERYQQACDRVEAVLPLTEGRERLVTSSALMVLAEARRLLEEEDAAEETAMRAQASSEELGNRLFATSARLTLGRLAAARGEWAVAQEHALAHLDTCVEGGHATHVPACLDALAEVAAGLGSNRDAVRLFAAAERARAKIGVVRVPPEERHWGAIDGQLRKALGADGYETARAEGAELTIDAALEWARRARGPRKRPAGGWEALTPTESKVVELVAEGLTNPQVGERMFISKATVKTHLAHIFRKLDVHSRTELGAQAAGRRKTGI